ncbi:MAG: caspase family protein [Catenulispora sp.]|nr:caspase family protein [Catenulispora sp.]
MEIAKRHARLYGVSSYQENSGIEDLPAAAANLDALKDLLPHWGFVVESTHNPVQSQIEQDLQISARKVSADDVFLLYLTGHAYLGEHRDDLYYATRSTYYLTDVEQYCYSLVAVLRALGRIEAKLKVLVLDSCYSGAATYLPAALDAGSARSSVAVLASSLRTRPSFAVPGEPLSRYTGALVECLAGFRRAEGDHVSLSTLAEELTRKMRERGGDQEPEHLFRGDLGLALLERTTPPAPLWSHSVKASTTGSTPRLTTPVVLTDGGRKAGSAYGRFLRAGAARGPGGAQVVPSTEPSSMLDAAPGSAPERGPEPPPPAARPRPRS